MPKTPNNYENTVIYKLVCNDLNITDCYVGHTTNFRARKRGHYSCCSNEKGSDYNYKIYETIRANGGWNNWSMIEIEKYPCLDANEARARERFWFEELNATLNGNKPNRTLEEWRDDNHNKIISSKKKYNDNNKEKIALYAQKNKDRIKEYKRQYWLRKKEELAKLKSAEISNEP